MFANNISQSIIAGLLMFGLAGFFGAPALAPSAAPDGRLVVHEWGTFTSVAGENGAAIEWQALSRTSDLPGFIYPESSVINGRRLTTEKNLRAQVRMETPVIYFYTDRETEVSLKVCFPKGHVTEWYPFARRSGEWYAFAPGDVVKPCDPPSSTVGERQGDSLDWGRFSVLPGAAMSLPVSENDSHYYPARETDAALVCVNGPKGQEYEKFLFYRGVGWFDLPLWARVADGKIHLRNLGPEPIQQVILFENRAGKSGYQLYGPLTGEAELDRPALAESSESLRRDLEEVLIQHGLYEKEAQAMVKTWLDQWFEEGLRVFYILPRQRTDEILPLTISPQPQEIVRVIVGRTELITTEMEQAVREQAAALEKEADAQATVQTLARQYGRFLEPILRRALGNTRDEKLKARLECLIAIARRAAE